VQSNVFALLKQKFLQEAAILLLKKADEERKAAVAALEKAAQEQRAFAEELGLEEEQGDAVGALITQLNDGSGGSKRVTLYEKKMNAIQNGQLRVVEESIMVPGRQSVLGNLVGRITGRQKTEIKSTIKLVQTEIPLPEPAAPPPATVEAAPISVDDFIMLDGLKLPPRESPLLEKYKKMLKAGLPQGAVELSLMRDGYHVSALFDDPINKPKSLPQKSPAPAPAAPAPPAPAPSSAGSGDVEMINGYKKPPRDSAELEKYKKMLKAGLPQVPVELALMRDMYHPSALFDEPLNNPGPVKKLAPAAVAAPAAAAAASTPSSAPASSSSSDSKYKLLSKDAPEMQKFVKMMNSGLPQGAVENALMREFISPRSLFDNPLNDVDKKPAATPAKPAAAKSAASPAAAPAVAKAAPADPGAKPAGMSMLEEMKWKQANKGPPKAFVEPVKAPPPKPAEPPRQLGVGPMPSGLSMMEEMKWKQAAKALKGDSAPAVIEIPKKEDAPKAAAPTVQLKSTAGSKPATSPAPGPTFKPPAAAAASAPAAKPGFGGAAASTSKTASPAVTATASSAAPSKGVEAVIALFVGAKIAADNAKKYALALAKEGYDAPEKLPLLDEADLVACGVTTRFDVKIILQLKATLNVAPIVAAAAAKAPTTPAAPNNAAGAKPSASVPVASPAAKAPAPGPVKPAAAPASTPAVVKPPVSAAPGAVNKPPVSAAPGGANKPPPAASAADSGEKKASPFGPSVGSSDKRAKEEAEKRERMAMALALTQPVKPIEKKPVGKR